MGKKTKSGNARRTRILHFIHEYIAQNGFSPSIREIAEAVELKAFSAAWYHLAQLKRQGDITYIKHRARTIRTTATLPPPQEPQ